MESHFDNGGNDYDNDNGRNQSNVILVHVDVIVPVHNSSETIVETISSALNQSIPKYLLNPSCHHNDVKTRDISQNINKNIECNYNHDDDDQQSIDCYERHPLSNVHLDVAICCYDDGSTDDSFHLLSEMKEKHDKLPLLQSSNSENCKISIGGGTIHSYILLSKDDDNISRGAPVARNRAALLRAQTDNHNHNHDIHNQFINTTTNSCCLNNNLYFICLLDADDIMHPHRISTQVSVMLNLSPSERHATLLGCTFNRIPHDSTWHYTQWANSLTDERLMLERFREVTVLQPTWFMTRYRFDSLGGYIEPDILSSSSDVSCSSASISKVANSTLDYNVYKLVHPKYDNNQTLRLAEDLRFFHAHLSTPIIHSIHNEFGSSSTIKREDGNVTLLAGIQPQLKLIRTKNPLLTYRHRLGQSQSSSTPRKLLLQLRTKAFEDLVIRSSTSSSNKNSKWNFLPNNENSQNNHTDAHVHDDTTCSANKIEKGFVIWGAGRDGKDFYKALSEDIKPFVKCFADVDEKKIISGYYITPSDSKNTNKIKVPIVHFSLLAKDPIIRERLMSEWISNDNNNNGDTTSNLKLHESISYGRICKKRKSQSTEILNEDKRSPEVFNIAEGVSISNREVSVNESKKPKNKMNDDSETRRRKLHNISSHDSESLEMLDSLMHLPVVVCVAMYRTNNVLETNVSMIGRTEGDDLWHFS